MYPTKVFSCKQKLIRMLHVYKRKIIYFLVTRHAIEVYYLCNGFQTYNIADVHHCKSVLVIILLAK